MAGESPTGPVGDLDTGEVLNAAWRLEEQIGAGGMGRVFRATDLKLGRKAAVKALSVHNLDEETLKRFERESQVMGKLNHPGVVTLYGVGRTRGVPWIAMRHLEGTSLWGVLDKHLPVLTPELLLPIARQLCSALGYIHERGLIHRDLKPSNIHVAPDGRTTLLDLGLARGRQSTLTRTGVVWGTPEYMSPEQILGERQLDGRSDLYALCVVLYRMMSGQLPFPHKEDQEVMKAHLTAPRPDITRVRPELSLLLGAALQKGLAIHLEDRFQSAAELLVALEHAMAPRPREPATSVAVRTVRTQTDVGVVAEPEPKNDGPTAPARLGTPTTSLHPDVTPKGRKITADAMPLAPPVPEVTPRGLSLMDDDDDSSQSTQREGFAPLDSTRPEGFVPLAGNAAPGMTLVDADSGPVPPLAPTSNERLPHVPARPTVIAKALPAVEAAAARPTTLVAKSLPAVAPIPVYLTPPYLIGALVLLLLGVVLGKLL
jgi:serine/threonine-protein kinase